MKSRSNNSNKTEKKMFDAKTVINNSSLETGCDLCLQRLSHKSTEKLNKKTQSSKTQNYFWKQTFSKITTDLGLQQKQRIKFQHLRKPVGPVSHETKSRAHKKSIFIKKTKLQTILQHDNV